MVYFKLIMGMISAVLYKQLNYAVDKITDTGHTTNNKCNTDYSKKLLMMRIVIISKDEHMKTEQSREMSI